MTHRKHLAQSLPWPGPGGTREDVVQMKFKSSLRKRVQRTAFFLRKQNADHIAGQALTHQNSDYQLFLQPLQGGTPVDWLPERTLPHPCSNMTTSLSLIIINAATVMVRKEKRIVFFWPFLQMVMPIQKNRKYNKYSSTKQMQWISPYNYISYILVTWMCYLRKRKNLFPDCSIAKMRNTIIVSVSDG